jgi:WD40 repeat protein
MSSLRRHGAPPTGTQLSKTSSGAKEQVVTASWDNTARVWGKRNGAEVFTLKGHTGGVESASFSPDGSRIVTGSRDKTAKVWDTRPFKPSILPRDLARGHGR